MKRSKRTAGQVKQSADWLAALKAGATEHRDRINQNLAAGRVWTDERRAAWREKAKTSWTPEKRAAAGARARARAQARRDAKGATA